MNTLKKPPIVISAFGTTTRALDTYAFIDEVLRSDFPGYEIHWAYSSRMVRDWIKKRRDIDLKHPHEVLEELAQKGHTWAVVQSLHLMAGHEFYRLVEEVSGCPVRVSVGLPLLSDPEDYQKLVAAMGPLLPVDDGAAAVLVGHGTDHPAWAAYPALQTHFRDAGFEKTFVGVVEDGYPDRDQILKKAKRSGYHRIWLAPLMMVAGIHFLEDLANGEDAWKPAFEAEGFSVALESQGLGYNRDVINIFSGHIRDALDIIPY
jgi:sirohydrochlorin cobaltochelatase